MRSRIENVLTNGVAVLLRAVVLVLLVLRIDVADFALSTTHPVFLRPHAGVTLITLCIIEYLRAYVIRIAIDPSSMRSPRWKRARYLDVMSTVRVGLIL